MKKRKGTRKFLKHGLLTLALILGLGIFAIPGSQPSFGIAAEWNITAVSANATMGTVTGGGIFAESDTVNLVATPNAGYRFVSWTEGLTQLSTDTAYTFTATASDRTLTANFAAIGKPTISSLSSAGYDSLKVKWGAVTGATSYNVYRATSATGTYSKIANVAATSYTDTGRAAGKYYYYKVKAVVINGASTTYGSASSYKYGKAVPATPVVTAVSSSYTSIKLSWASIPGANGYYVYRATSSTGTYTNIGTTTSTAYSSKSLTTGKTYYYKVKAYHLEGTTKVFGSVSAVKYAKPVPATPKCAVATKTSTKAKVAWTAVTGATKYQVYRATVAGGPFTLAYTASSSATSYVDPGLKTGTTYYYKVRAYHLEGTTKVYGACSDIKTLVLGSSYGNGDYKVGTDIPAGEYLLITTDEIGMFYTSTDLAGDNVLNYGFAYPTLYATFRAGEYVHFADLKAYPVASAPTMPVNDDGSFTPGQYKVGRDIPAGDYVIIYTDPTDFGDMYIESDSYNELDSIVGSDLYRGRIYVTLTEGQYFSFDSGVAYPKASAPALDKSQPNLHDGMYLVGTDIPAGTYTIVTKDADWGYYSVYADATHSEDSVIDYDILDTNKQVTVEDGQYLYVFEGYFAQLTP